MIIVKNFLFSNLICEDTPNMDVPIVINLNTVHSIRAAHYTETNEDCIKIITINDIYVLREDPLIFFKQFKEYLQKNETNNSH